MRKAALAIRMLWFAPLMLGALIRGARGVVRADVERWLQVVDAPAIRRPARLALLATYREFRSLYLYRLRRASNLGAALSAVLGIVYPGERTLHLACSDIGPGLFIQHGFATIIAARKLGANCWVNQQVTIGFDRPDARPTLGDNVSVYAGAKVLGEIHVGDGARIGANAVVLEDVPAGNTAVGIPARNLPPKGQRS
jgi:serine O-acetyltransferase